MMNSLTTFAAAAIALFAIGQALAEQARSTEQGLGDRRVGIERVQLADAASGIQPAWTIRR